MIILGGREIDTAGDGFLTSFDSPTTAITCARAVLGSVDEIGVDLRIGLPRASVTSSETSSGASPSISARGSRPMQVQARSSFRRP
jgi:class 3 adenylate cyclase